MPSAHERPLRQEQDTRAPIAHHEGARPSSDKDRHLNYPANPYFSVLYATRSIRYGTYSFPRSVNSPASAVRASAPFIGESKRFSAISMERGTVRVKDRLRRSNRL